MHFLFNIIFARKDRIIRSFFMLYREGKIPYSITMNRWIGIMKKYDMRWLDRTEELVFDGDKVYPKEDAPEWVWESYKHYLRQISENVED